eukprot:m.1642484 g.1642484  ORF g.1642484 m.1642484 type:complete len:408 (+) comp53661_c0_seq1:106-1329(+)
MESQDPLDDCDDNRVQPNASPTNDNSPTAPDLKVRFESTPPPSPPPAMNNTAGGQESSTQSTLDLTEAQIAGFRKVFQYFDKDDNGSVDSSEIFSQATTLGLDVSYEQVSGAVQAKNNTRELTFVEFLEILTCTDRYLETLRNEAGPKEAVMFSVVSKYLRTARQNESDGSDLTELEKYYSHKAKTLQPHVIADYAAGHRLIGLSEKQLERGMKKLFQPQPGTSHSPYGNTFSNLPRMWQSISMYGSSNRKSRPQPCNAREKLPCPIPSSRFRHPPPLATLDHVTMATGTLKDDQPKPQPPCESPLAAPTNRGGLYPVSKYRVRKITLPRLPPKHYQSCPPTVYQLRSDVNRVVRTQRLVRDQQRLQLSKQHWERMETENILGTTLQNRFAKTFLVYSGGGCVEAQT